MDQDIAFIVAWTRLKRIEGAYSDDPDDAGGKTNYGITEEVARYNGYEGKMSELPEGFARGVAKRRYWDVLRLDNVTELSQEIAIELFDTGYNMGPAQPASFLQRSLNALNNQEDRYDDLVVDGVLGPRSVGVLAEYLNDRPGGEDVLLSCLNGLQLAEYVRQVETRESSERFFYGWVANRVVM